MRVQAKIQKWGNSLALRLAGPLKTIPHFEEDMSVNVDVTEQGIQVEPVRQVKRKKLPFTEEQLLSGLTDYEAHSNELTDLLDEEWDV